MIGFSMKYHVFFAFSLTASSQRAVGGAFGSRTMSLCRRRRIVALLSFLAHHATARAPSHLAGPVAPEPVLVVVRPLFVRVVLWITARNLPRPRDELTVRATVVVARAVALVFCFENTLVCPK